MAGENQNTQNAQVEEDTSDFDSYAKARGENAVQQNDTEDQQRKKDEKEGLRKRDDKGRFISGDDKGAQGESGDTADTGDTGDSTGQDNMGWLKKRVERERKKAKAKDQKIAELEAKLAAQNSGGEPPKQTQDSGVELKEPVEPKRDDFENNDAYVDAMVDFWEAEEIYKEKANAGDAPKADEGQQAQGDAQKSEGKENEQKADEKESVLDEPTEYDDLLEVLDEHPDSDDFYEDFRIGVEEGKIQMPESVVDWLLINEDKAANVVRAFIEKPRLSRNVSRQVGARQEQTLNQIANTYEPGGQAQGGEQQTDTGPSLTDIRGTSRAPQRALEDVDNFEDYKTRRKSTAALNGQPFGWG